MRQIVAETWIPVPGARGYAVSDGGRVRSLDRIKLVCQRTRAGKKIRLRRTLRGKILRAGIASHGYKTVSLSGVTHTVHSLVARAFLGDPAPGQIVCHNNGDRLDSRLENLRYGTAKENNHDMVAHGTRTRGEMYSNAKLTDEAVREIRRLKGNLSLTKTAAKFGVSVAAIQAVHKRRTWTHV